MAADSQVTLEIEVLAGKAAKAIADFTKDAGSALDGMNSSLGALKSGLQAAVALVAVHKIAEFFEGAIDQAKDQEAAISRLNTALATSGEYSDAASQQMQDFASSMQETTKYADDVILNQLSLAKSFGASNEQAKTLVTAATELSAATGIDLNDAVSKLGKTFSGEAGKLGAQIPALKGLTEAQLKAGDAIDIVLKRFSGSAAAEVDTFAGALAQNTNAWDDVRKAIGNFVVQNPVVTTAIQSLSSVFAELQTLITDNDDTIRTFVSGSVKGLAIGFDIAVEAADILARALEGLVSVGALAFTGLVEAGASLTEGLVTQFQAAVDTFLGMGETIARGIKDVPVLGAAFKTLGIDTDGLADSISDLHRGFYETSTAAIETAREMSDSVAEGSAATISKIEDMQTSQDKFVGAVRSGTAAVLAADGDVIKSARAVANAEKEKAGLTAAEMKKLAELRKQAADFVHQVVTDTLSDEEKVDQKRRDSLEKIRYFHDQHVISAEDEATAVLAINEKAADELAAAWEKASNQAADKARKAAEDARKAIEEAGSDPVKFGIKFLDIQPADIAPLTAQVASAGVGLLGNVLKGAAGAKDLIAQGAGAFADAFIPGIGPAVAGVIGQLEQGPEATKKFVREFIDQIPEIMDAIGEAIPAVVEAFVDSMINEGGAIRIGVAIIRAMAGEGILKSIGAQIGLEFGNKFTDAAGAVPGKIETGFQHGLEKLAAGLENVFAKLRDSLFSFKFPALPEFKGWPDLPKFTWPEIPEPGWLKKISNPGGSVGGGGGGNNPVGVAIDIQKKIFTGGLGLTDSGSYGDYAPTVGSPSPTDGGEGVTQALLAKIVALLSGQQYAQITLMLDGQKLADQIAQLSRRNALRLT